MNNQEVGKLLRKDDLSKIKISNTKTNDHHQILNVVLDTPCLQTRSNLFMNPSNYNKIQYNCYNFVWKTNFKSS